MEPLGTIGHPDANMIPRRNASSHETARNLIDAPIELGIGLRMGRTVGSYEVDRRLRAPTMGSATGEIAKPQDFEMCWCRHLARVAASRLPMQTGRHTTASDEKMSVGAEH
jgi:hypothetical protein